MTNFLARVELKGSPTHETYQRLHERMTEINFYNHVYPGQDGEVDWLPHATYYNVTAPTQNIKNFYNALKDHLLAAGLVFKATLVEVAALETTAHDKWEGEP